LKEKTSWQKKNKYPCRRRADGISFDSVRERRSGGRNKIINYLIKIIKIMIMMIIIIIIIIMIKIMIKNIIYIHITGIDLCSKIKRATKTGRKAAAI
jgi:hypothetical protein